MRRCRRRPLADYFERRALELLEQAKLEQDPIRKDRHPTGLAAIGWRNIALAVELGAKKARQTTSLEGTHTCFVAKRSPNIVCPSPNAVNRIPDIRIRGGAKLIAA